MKSQTVLCLNNFFSSNGFFTEDIKLLHCFQLHCQALLSKNRGFTWFTFCEPLLVMYCFVTFLSVKYIISSKSFFWAVGTHVSSSEALFPFGKIFLTWGSRQWTEQWTFCDAWIIFQNYHCLFRSQQCTQVGQMLCPNLCYLAFCVLSSPSFITRRWSAIQPLVLIIPCNSVASAGFCHLANHF